MKYNKTLTKEQRQKLKNEYTKVWRNKNRKRVNELARIRYIKNKHKYKELKWGHYSKGKKCTECNKPIVNVSTGKCRTCTLTKKIKKDIDSYLYRQRNPEKVKARKIVYHYIKVGRLKRLPCEVCGKPKSEAHHDDYSKPLEVKWFCKFHHHLIGHNKTPELKKENERKYSQAYRNKNRDKINQKQNERYRLKKLNSVSVT